MKITKTKLKQIIKEELEAAMAGGGQLDPQEALRMVCGAKPAILLALDNPKFGRIVLEGIFKAKGGEAAQHAMQLVDMFEDMTKMKVEDILKMPFAKMAVTTALNLACPN